VFSYGRGTPVVGAVSDVGAVSEGGGGTCISTSSPAWRERESRPRTNTRCGRGGGVQSARGGGGVRSPRRYLYFDVLARVEQLSDLRYHPLQRQRHLLLAWCVQSPLFTGAVIRGSRPPYEGVTTPLRPQNGQISVERGSWPS